MNYWNLMKIVGAIFEKSPISFRAVIWKALIFGARMFIVAGHRPMMGKLLHTEREYNPSNRWGTSEVHVPTYRRHSKNNSFVFMWTKKPVNPSKSRHRFYMLTTPSHIYHIHKKIMQQARLYQASWLIGKALHLYSGDRFKSWTDHRLFWSLSWFLSVSPNNCWDITLIRPRPLPFRSFPIYNLFIDLPLDAVKSSYWQWHQLRHKNKTNQ
jgi:hypothetical protein